MDDIQDLSNKSILLNASNLHVGGGVQVAVSIISELSNFDSLPDNLTIWVSSEVFENLSALNIDVCCFPNFRVVDCYGLKMAFSGFANELAKFDAVYTVFGPLYVFHKPRVSIVGFAQGLLIYPNIFKKSALLRIIDFLRFRIQLFFWKKSDALVVELDHVKNQLENFSPLGKKRMHVIPNCLSSIYAEPDCWEDVQILMPRADIHLGVVGRNYDHKNTAVLPVVKSILKARYGLDVAIYVTFTDAEWCECSAEFRQSIINVGALRVGQCPIFYRKMYGVLFPSLLECFSATPLEAMAMGKPLFASDRMFNRDICGDYAFYFDPLDAVSIAKSVSDYYCAESSFRSDMIDRAKRYAFDFSSPQERARMSLILLESSIGSKA